MLRLTPEAFTQLQAKIKAIPRQTAGTATHRAKRTKYGNEVTMSAGIRFDSKAEAERWHYLSTLQEAGEITELKHHVPFDLLPAQEIDGRKERPVRYEADFTYMKGGKLVVEDVKSGPTKTKEYTIKRKMLLFFHKIAVTEVMAK